MGLAAAGGSDHQNIALLDLHIVLGEHDALIVVVDRYAQRDLGAVLADDILVQRRLHFGRRGQAALQRKTVGSLFPVIFFIDQISADAHTVIANIGIGSGDQPFHFILGAAAEAAAHIFFIVTRHSASSFQQV